MESFNGPNAGLTEVLVPAGYADTAYDPVFRLSDDQTGYVPTPSDIPTPLPEPGLPFSLVFRADPGREGTLLRIASAYEAASRRRIPPARLRAAVKPESTLPSSHSRISTGCRIVSPESLEVLEAV